MPLESITSVAPCSSNSKTSAGWMPGTCCVPVSLQSHSLEPPGKSLASLKGFSCPSTLILPQERCVIRGERVFSSVIFRLLIKRLKGYVLYVQWEKDCYLTTVFIHLKILRYFEQGGVSLCCIYLIECYE